MWALHYCSCLSCVEFHEYPEASVDVPMMMMMMMSGKKTFFFYGMFLEEQMASTETSGRVSMTPPRRMSWAETARRKMWHYDVTPRHVSVNGRVWDLEVILLAFSRRLSGHSHALAAFTPEKMSLIEGHVVPRAV